MNQQWGILVASVLGLSSVLVSSVLVPSVQAGEPGKSWVRILSDREGSLHIDRDSIEAEGNIRHFWAYARANRPFLKMDGQDIYSWSFNMSANCDSPEGLQINYVQFLDANQQIIKQKDIRGVNEQSRYLKIGKPFTQIFTNYACAQR